MNAKLVWLREKYNYRSQTHIGGSSSQTHEICDVYLTEKELHQLHLDEEVLREILEEEARDEKEREEKIRQKQADDEEFILEFGVVKYDSKHESDNLCIVQTTNLNNKNGQWELSLDIDDLDLRLTPVLRPSSSTLVQTPLSTQRPAGIIPDPAGGIKKFLNKGKLDQVVAIVKSCSSNAIGDLTVTMKDLSGTIPKTIHHKVIGEGGYENDITVGAALILVNVSIFSPKLSMHYLNITKRNVVKVFPKDTVPGSGSGSG
ncbi:transposase, MuDR, MULE transposase domain protein [Tanacetum coccineum]